VTIDRRNFLRLGGLGMAAAAASPALAACGSGGGSSGGTDLVLSTWNIPEDIKSYTKFAEDYARANSGVKIKVQVTPSGDFNQWFTTQLAANKAPDIIRMTYQTYGRYATNGALVKLDDRLPGGYPDDFAPSFWQAVKTDKGVYGLPQHTDTFATYYHKDVLQKAGVTAPTELAKAWTWDEFRDVARKVKAATGKYAFAYGFQGVNTAYRWLPILYMHGGRLLEDDLKTPAINNAAGVEAIEFTRSWYADGLVPPSDTIKATQDGTADQLFTSGNVGMLIHGDWIMQNFGSLPAGSWDATYMIRDLSAASDLGGNVLAVTRSAKNAKVAADFVAFVCNQDNMKYFCAHDLFLPVRTSLLSQPLDFVANAANMQRFVSQAATVPPPMVRVETSPKFDPINQALADQLDLCFTGQQSAADTAKKIADGVSRAVA
jgi:multiple sugar transport system substrate-binding protein